MREDHQMTVWTLAVGAALACIGMTSASAVQGRATVSLDGRWQFKLDRQGAGAEQRWFSKKVPFADAIQVPGGWDAQGYGDETPKFRHSFVRKGWYRREVTIPAAWPGKRVFLRVGGVYRYARVWVNDACLGEHVGYLSAFEFDVTDHVAPGRTAVIAVEVDSKQRPEIETLLGCMDLADFVDGQMGGAIWGHVTLEARSQAWLADPFVLSELSPTRCTVSAAVVGRRSVCDAVGLTILDQAGQRVADVRTSLAQAIDTAGRVSARLGMPEAKLWSPDAPNLYTARMSLLKGDAVVDSIATRFGMRTIQIRGPFFYLNGTKLFLRGYGDDNVYPETLFPPSDKNYYLRRLRLVKEYGFNHVRHHSHILPPEYYDACDEVGVLVSAEFPIAYRHWLDRAKDKPEAIARLKEQWTAAITRHRNHPSIFDWSMCNEIYDDWGWASELRQEMYRIAKTLDPQRLVIDSDGPGVGHDKKTLDFYVQQFDVANTPLEHPDKFAFDRPIKPVLSHETGNYVTFPRLDQIELFRHAVKPYWLTSAKAKLEGQGLLDEWPTWSLNSERLYYLCHKLNLEELRKNPYMSGYHWWLFQNYWERSNGLVDTYFRQKSNTPEMVRKINGPVVLLQDGLDLTYRGGRPLDLDLLISNYAETDLSDGQLRWWIKQGQRTLASDVARVDRVPQGMVVKLTHVRCKLPDPEKPTRLGIEVELRAGGQRFVNDWATWLYPSEIAKPRLAVPFLVSEELLGRFAGYGAKPLRSKDAIPAKAVCVVNQPYRSLLDAMVAGTCAIVMSPELALPTAPTRFKTAWWAGNTRDSNAGTVVYDNPITRDMAPDGWCDAGWFRLLNESRGYLLDAFSAQPEVLVRGIEVHYTCRNKAMLFQARVGKGCLIASGFNLTASAPEVEWLMSRMVAHAATFPTPSAELPAEYLRKLLPEMPVLPDGPYVQGFLRMTDEGEKATWMTYREDQASVYICRQTEIGHKVEWETAPVGKTIADDKITFLFAGAVGYLSQPKTDGFVFLVNGKEAFAFDVVSKSQVWASEDKNVRVVFFVKRTVGPDAFGLFYVTVDRSLLTPGKPCRFGVRSKGRNSRRWFAVNTYTDLVR